MSNNLFCKLDLALKKREPFLKGKGNHIFQRGENIVRDYTTTLLYIINLITFLHYCFFITIIPFLNFTTLLNLHQPLTLTFLPQGICLKSIFSFLIFLFHKMIFLIFSMHIVFCWFYWCSYVHNFFSFLKLFLFLFWSYYCLNLFVVC